METIKIKRETFNAIIESIIQRRDGGFMRNVDLSRDVYFKDELKIAGELPQYFEVQMELEAHKTCVPCYTTYEVISVDDLTCRLEIVKEIIQGMNWLKSDEVRLSKEK